MAQKRNKWKTLYKDQATFVCPYCLRTLPSEKATKEFEPPKSRQKKLVPSKILRACEACNQEKGALTAEEYKQWKNCHDFYAWIRLENLRTGKIK